MTGTCPICGKPAATETTPFCSRRCADVDLHRWLSGGYAIPAVETDDEDGDEALNEALSEALNDPRNNPRNTSGNDSRSARPRQAGSRDDPALH